MQAGINEKDVHGHAIDRVVTSETIGHTKEAEQLKQLGYTQELKRNRSLFTLLFQSLAIAGMSLLFLKEDNVESG